MAEDTDGTLIWVGSYTSDSNGQGSGIGAVAAREDGSLRWLGTAVEAPSPSFLAIHPTLPVVYAVAEAAQTVRAYRRTGLFGLEALGDAWPAGAAACHVAVDPSGRFIVVACWGDGNVLLYRLDDDGGITSRFAAPAAKDPHAGVDGGIDIATGGGRVSRAHASLMLDDGRIMTTDLGFDLVRVWNYYPDSGLLLDHEIALPMGSGPRHLVQHPSASAVFVVTEYSIEVAVLLPGADGRFVLHRRGPATAGGAADGDAAAEIALSPSGRFVYTGIRGSNRISVLSVEGSGTRLRPVADVPSGGDWPRHHLVRGGWLHVAHERSQEVTTFGLDASTGVPGEVLDRLETGSPTVLRVAG
ncbi:lactonase family protein [Arthrobacter bambusae]|uniref:lactonase family protein n=1 Tax=Arthrobacter bambusae TaxID=1338426 RepID=UPI00278A556F|nr:beta-propeller fold lactonase family protein [Arthrobacter bambusae]MDQ0030738.1 6-phosphogluconolactonase (cycloisomerase 2 family) [Arthrobacter bambusae]MDQ0098975.1 6-phosphogluconolactonase (cycloisomerase 2 family) [Arthrobacter bambusae]